jgi:hypothetical protein
MGELRDEEPSMLGTPLEARALSCGRRSSRRGVWSEGMQGAQGSTHAVVSSLTMGVRGFAPVSHGAVSGWTSTHVMRVVLACWRWGILGGQPVMWPVRAAVSSPCQDGVVAAAPPLWRVSVWAIGRPDLLSIPN